MFQKKIKFLIYFVALLLGGVFIFSWVRYDANPSQIVKYLVAQIGSSVGVSLSVPENPFNTWAKQLLEKEAELQEREQKINEILVKIERESKIILSLILFLMIILMFLIFLNFYLDYKSKRFQKV